MENKFYTIDQVAEILGIHHKTVRKFIKEGKLNANKLGKQWRISPLDLERFTKVEDSIDESEAISYDEEIELSNNELNFEVKNEIKVSSVIDLEGIDSDEYSRISNMLLAIMNCKNDSLQKNTINIKYSKNVNRLRVMLWANINTTKEVLDVIEMLREDKK
ncbi:MAG: helix-turn-helix domain-containing protein [Clostridium sp.]|nr:helix-turn-helix domain-containing protein [Clostridium sp.]